MASKTSNLLDSIHAAARGTLPTKMPPPVKNRDGSSSTVRTISVGTDRGEVLIPTVVNGRVVSNDEAVKRYRRTGEHFGIYKSVGEANRAGEALHKSHEQQMRKR